MRRVSLAGLAALVACSQPQGRNRPARPGPASRPAATSSATVQALSAATKPQSRPTRAAPVHPATSEADGPFAHTIWSSAADVRAACKSHLARAAQKRRALLSIDQGQPRTTSNTLVPLNELFIELDRVVPRAQLLANVHPDAAFRKAAETCERQADKLHTALMLDRKVYDALRAVDTEGLDRVDKRFVAHLLRDYRRAGVDREPHVRRELGQLKKQMTELGQTFDRNIRKDQRHIDVTEEELEGLPADFIEARRERAAKRATKRATDKDKAGTATKIRITTAYPDFYPVQSYAKREDVRRRLYIAYLSRAYPANVEIIEKLLAARHRYAKLLGYHDWAAYNAEDKMVRDKRTIRRFIRKVARLARPRMKADLRALLARKRKDHPKAQRVEVWDRFYYVKQVQKERFGVDPAKVRPYFAFRRVKRGLLELAQELFELRFERVAAARVWHPSVEAYDVYDHGKLIGRFYLDLHPRKNKYSHAAEFPILSGVEGRQLPAAALVTNFPDPSASRRPALMEHDQVGTFFHEFGHLMHQLLSGHKRWVTQAGISCEWDFVEAPSQIFEEWTWNAKVLSRFAHHYATGRPIPAALVERMRRADRFGKGVHVMRQMFYAQLSFAYHSRDPAQIDLMESAKRVQRRFSPYPFTPKTAVFASFGHLNGYSSMYYTYMWSLVLAKDLFTRFAKEGLLNPRTARAYREAILAPGGTVDAEKMIRKFLGRPYSFAAYKRWLAR